MKRFQHKYLSILLNFTLFITFHFYMGVFAIEAQSIRPRIINGSDSIIDAKWVTSLSDKDSELNICGGTLIRSDTIVTAAHCVIDFQHKLAKLRITLGRKNLSDKSQGIEVDAVHIVIHPLYKLSSLDYDIALVKLAETSNFPIAHFKETMPLIYGADTLMNIFGWGSTNPEFYVFPNTLQQASIPTIDSATCSNLLGSEFNNSTMFCAGVLSGNTEVQNGIDSCVGDSGSPIGIYENEKFFITGITSWGYECASNKYPGVYVNISRFYDWIISNPQDEPYAITRPKVKGLPVVGNTLKCITGGWSDGNNTDVSFQWVDSKTGLIIGANRSKFKLRKRDIGRRLKCEVMKTRFVNASISHSKVTGYVFPALTSIKFNRRSNTYLKNIYKGCINKKCYVMLNLNKETLSINAIANNMTSCDRYTECKKNTRWHSSSSLFFGEQLWGFALPSGFDSMLMYVRIVLKNYKTAVTEVNIT